MEPKVHKAPLVKTALRETKEIKDKKDRLVIRAHRATKAHRVLLVKMALRVTKVKKV